MSSEMINDDIKLDFFLKEERVKFHFSLLINTNNSGHMTL